MTIHVYGVDAVRHASMNGGTTALCGLRIPHFGRHHVPGTFATNQGAYDFLSRSPEYTHCPECIVSLRATLSAMVTVYQSSYMRIDWNRSATFNVYVSGPFGIWVEEDCFTKYGVDSVDAATVAAYDYAWAE